MTSEILVLGLTLVWVALMMRAMLRREFDPNAVAFLGSMGGSIGTFLNPFSQVRKGSNEMQGGVTQAENYQKQSYKENQGYLQPWQEVSDANMASYRDLMGYNGEEGRQRALAALRSDPSYQYSVDQAMNQVQGTAAGKGNLNSGRTLMALQDRAKNLSDQNYANYYNRVMNGMQIGQGTTNARIGLNQGYYGTMSDLALKRAGIKTQELQGYTDLRKSANDHTLEWMTSIGQMKSGGLLGGGKDTKKPVDKNTYTGNDLWATG